MNVIFSHLKLLNINTIDLFPSSTLARRHLKLFDIYITRTLFSSLSTLAHRTVSGVQFVVIFVLGMPDMESLDVEIPSSHDNSETKKKELAAMKERIYEDTMHKLVVESQIFKDIVMGNFTDSYR